MAGAPGAPGRSGPVGPPGRSGKRGPQGDLGPRGLPGDIGEYGKDGRDGVCNCSFPDMFIKKVEVPGPTEILVKEITVEVPHIIIKEVTVPVTPGPVSATPLWPPPIVVTGRPRITPTWKKPTTLAPETPGLHTKRFTDVSHKERVTVPPIKPPQLETVGTQPVVKTTKTKAPTTTTTPAYTGPPTLGTNRRRCALDAVGIPVQHGETQFRSRVGAWMRDSLPVNVEMEKHRWVTDSYASEVLYEYKNERYLRNKKQLIKYYVDYLASGTGGIIHNGSYFYHRRDSEFVVRYDLNSTNQTQRRMPGMAHKDCRRRLDENQLFEHCNETERHPWLYNIPHNYVDFAVDENGLWVVYLYPDKPWLGVSKLEFWDLHIVATWNISAENVTDVQNTFIMCGVIYGLQSAKTLLTQINFAYDLYQEKVKYANVTWRNPDFQKDTPIFTTMLDYNPYDQRIYFFNQGWMYSVNVRTKKKINENETVEIDDRGFD